MAKAVKKQLDENGNLVDVELSGTISSNSFGVFNEIIEVKKKREPKEYIFQLANTYYSSTSNYAKPPYPETYSIKNQDMIFDEETGKERNIRYLEGVGTIYEDEQEQLSDSKKKQRPRIVFVNGILSVPANKTSLIKFLMLSNMNQGNKNRMGGRVVYKLLDFEKQESDALSIAETRMDAMKLAMDAPIESMIPHGQYLGIRFKNQFGEDRGDKAIRVDYLEFADKNPDTFIKTYNNPVVKIQYIINRAINVNMIDLSFTKGQAVWGDTKKFIAQIPDNAQPIKFLSELCLTDKGKDFYAQLKSMVE